MSVSNYTNPATVHWYPLQLRFIGKAIVVNLFAVVTNSSDGWIVQNFHFFFDETWGRSVPNWLRSAPMPACKSNSQRLCSQLMQVVFCLNKERSFEPIICLDLVLECSQSPFRFFSCQLKQLKVFQNQGWLTRVQEKGFSMMASPTISSTLYLPDWYPNSLALAPTS